MSAKDSIVQIFAKAPIEGFCKTRLAKDTGIQQATSFHASMVEDTLSRLVNHHNLQLWCKPDSQHPFFQAMIKKYSVPVFNQQGDSLGIIMENAAIQATGTTGTALVQIGTDCPGLDHIYIHKALGALENTDIVIGPAEDGGYVLLAQKTCHAHLYRDINWGTSLVLKQLEDNIRKLGFEYTLLYSLPDIDTLEDLKLIMTERNQWGISQ